MISDFRLLYVKHNQNSYVYSLRDAPIAYHDLTFVISGSLTYFLDGKEVVISAGDAMFAQEGTFRARVAQESGSVEYVAFNFLCQQDVDLPQKIENCLDGEIPFLLQAVDKTQETPNQSGEKVAEQILKCLLTSLQSREQERKKHPLVVAVQRYLHAHLSEKINLSDISRETFFSVARLEEIFRRETGVSIIEYLLKERIRRAKRLLTEGALSLTQTANEVGFDDYNYFSRTFKKRTGVSPLAYRRLHTQKQ